MKLEVAEALWDDLLTEVAEELQGMDRLLQRRRSTMVATSGRQRPLQRGLQQGLADSY